MIEWRKQYVEPERDAELGELSAVDCSDLPDLTLQQYKDDTDVNVLMRRFGVTGQLPVSSVKPFYGDFSEVGSYQDALNRVREAEAAFAALPSKVRNRFRNDPGELIAFVMDASNVDEARELGLLPRELAAAGAAGAGEKPAESPPSADGL